MVKYLQLLIIFLLLIFTNNTTKADGFLDVFAGTQLSYVNTFGQDKLINFDLGTGDLTIPFKNYNNNVNSIYVNMNLHLGIGKLRLNSDTTNKSVLKGWLVNLNLSRNFQTDVELLNTTYSAMLFYKVFDSIPIFEDMLIAPVLGLTFNTYAVHNNQLVGKSIYSVNREDNNGNMFYTLSNWDKVSILQNTENINVGFNILYPIYNNNSFDLFLNSSVTMSVAVSSEVRFSYGNGIIDITKDVQWSNDEYLFAMLRTLSHHHFAVGVGLVAKYKL